MADAHDAGVQEGVQRGPAAVHFQRFSMRTSRIRGDGSASPRQAALAVYR
jgi:hypothetical protein